MIYAIYLNPTIDKTIYIDHFTVGGTNRVKNSILQGGGKALNLSVVLNRLGVPAYVTGFLCNRECSPIRNGLEDILTSFYTLEGEPRVNIKIVDRTASITTEINDKGPIVSIEALTEFEKGLLHLVKPEDTVVLTGSLPQGCPSDYYCQLMAMLPCRCVLDASGETLRQGIQQNPYLIKPNLEELGQLTGEKYTSDDIPAIIAVCRRFIQNGVGVCVVSMGGDGALIINAEEAYFSKAVVNNPDSTVGAGDSMLAGVLSVLNRGGALCEALAVGTAAAAATISLPGTTLASRELIMQLLPSIHPEKII